MTVIFSGEEPEEAQAQPMDRPEKTIKVGDKEILFRGLTEGQYMQLVRETSIFKSDTIGMDRKLKSIERLYKVILSLVKDEDEREYVEDQMAEGTIDVSFLLQALKEIYSKPAGAVKQKVQRGRPARRS